MKSYSFAFVFIILVIVQVFLGTLLDFSRFVTISILPLLIMCLSVRRSTVFTMIISFAVAIAVDFFTDGMLGRTAIALLPVALSRRFVISLVFGQELFARNEEITFRRQGIVKFAISIFMLTMLYFLIYVIVDAAGTRDFLFNFVRFLLSTTVSTVVSTLLSAFLTSVN